MGTFFPPQLPKYGKNNNVYKNCCKNLAILLGNFPPIPKDWSKIIKNNFPPIPKDWNNNREIIFPQFQ
jgi:hypothetical protein